MSTYYINADTGNDTTGNGSISTPWKTFSKAHTSAATGDTIIVQDSVATYTWPSIVFSSKNLTYIGEQDDASGAVVDAGGGIGSWYFQGGVTETFQNITFQNATPTTFIGLFYTPSGSNTINLINVKFKSIILTNLTYYMAFDGTAQTINLTNVEFDRPVGSGTPSAAFIKVITGTANITHTGCIGYVNNTGTALVPHMFLGGTHTMKNCIYRDEQGVTTFRSGGTFTITYSIVNNVLTPPTLGTGSISSDPLFVGAPRGQYNLKSGSPARALGVIP